MNDRCIRYAALALALSLVPLANYWRPASAQTYSIAASNAITLSPAEQDVLNEINQARQHPIEYASYLEGLKPFFKGKEYTPKGQPTLVTNEGWPAVDEAIRFLRAAKPQPPLSMSRGLCLAALAHVKDQSGTGATGHRGASNDMIEDRLKPYGTWQGGVGENLSYGKASARERVITWLVDDGVSSRGHRVRLLSPDYKVAGLSCGPHLQYGTMCVITLAGGFTDLQTQTTATSQTKPAKQTSKPKTKRTARRL